MFNGHWADKIAAALRTLLREAGYVGLIAIQGAFVGSFTFYDLVARSIEKIVRISDRFREQTEGLLGHMLRFAGKVVHKITDLSFKFIKYVFNLLLKKLNSSVFRALK